MKMMLSWQMWNKVLSGLPKPRMSNASYLLIGSTVQGRLGLGNSKQSKDKKKTKPMHGVGTTGRTCTSTVFILRRNCLKLG